MSSLPHCAYRRVDADGVILCERIKQGDRAVQADLCRACPVAAIDCALLRATLSLYSRPPIRVRYGNGRTDIWAGEDPRLTLNQAACSEKIIPIISPHDCSGCLVRQSVSYPHAASSRRPAPPTPTRITRTPRPVITITPWLGSSSTSHPSTPAQSVCVSPHPPAPHPEEKCVGWTD